MIHQLAQKTSFEPDIQEMIKDPIVVTLMNRDGVKPTGLHTLCMQVAEERKHLSRAQASR